MTNLIIRARSSGLTSAKMDSKFEGTDLLDWTPEGSIQPSKSFTQIWAVLSEDGFEVRRRGLAKLDAYQWDRNGLDVSESAVNADCPRIPRRHTISGTT